MGAAAEVLLLDDGDGLAAVRAVLQALEVPCMHLRGRPQGMLHLPSRLLVTTWRRALDLPDLQPGAADAPDPVWVCVHDQDSAAMRARLRGMGAHVLVNRLVDDDGLRILFSQLLAPERADDDEDTARPPDEVPVQCPVLYRVDGEEYDSAVSRLSRSGAELLSWRSLPEKRGIDVMVASAEGSECTLPAEVIGCSERDDVEAGPPFRLDVAWGRLGEAGHEVLEQMLSGRLPATQVSVLRTLPRSRGSRETTQAVERRRSPRLYYGVRLHALTALAGATTQVVAGYDLSAHGIRLERHPDFELGREVAIALGRGPAASPLVVQARIVRDAGEEGFGAEFTSLDDEQRQQILDLIADLEPLQRLTNFASAPRPSED